MKEVFAIDFIKTGLGDVIALRKKSGKYLISPVENLAGCTSDAEPFIRKNAGRVISVFPFANTYFHELSIPAKISRKSYNHVIKTSTEAALPIHLNGQFHFDLPLNASGGERRRLQLVTAIPEGLKSLYESEMIELQPSAFFEGFSHLFKIPAHQKCFLFYHATEYILLLTGQDKKIEKMRMIRSLDENQTANIVSVFLSESRVDSLYSWCTEKEEKLLSALTISQSSAHRWSHLKNIQLPLEIQSYKDKIELLCHAVALFEGLITPCPRISPFRFSFVQGILGKQLNNMAAAVSALLLVLFLYFCVQLRKERSAEDILNRNISDMFYSFFPPQTPMINPAQQIFELFQTDRPGNKSLQNLPDAGIFLQLLSKFFQDKASDQTVMRITQEGDHIYIEGKYQSKEALEKSAHAFDDTALGGLEIRLIKIEQPDKGHYRLVFDCEKAVL